MKNVVMAKSYVKQAEERVKHAEEALTWAQYTLKLIAKLYNEVARNV